MAKLLNEPRKVSHQLFLLTIIAKGLLGLVQLATALAIMFGKMQLLPKYIEWIFKAELGQDPKDFLATKIISLAGLIPHANLSFYMAYFLAHGLLHVGVVAALLYGAKWADYAAIAVLAAFVVYQVFEWFSIGGIMLLVLTAIDLAVIYLTVVEIRQKK